MEFAAKQLIHAFALEPLIGGAHRQATQAGTFWMLMLPPTA